MDQDLLDATGKVGSNASTEQFNWRISRQSDTATQTLSTGVKWPCCKPPKHQKPRFQKFQN
ncbi:hypothetical protein, partial [Arachidicoccus sp.]|uniref:hypothetical protein n=1 Tax=Arachidicoccus sp. TaxID=1872624 RepID=UPI003D1CC839